MRRALALAAVLSVLPVRPDAQATEPVDRAAILKIRDEGLNRSQVMDTAFWLTDRYGPRLTGSPEFDEAADWAIERLRSYGVQSLRKERFTAGYGWSLARFHATMTAPRLMPIIATPVAWTPGLSSVISAPVVRPIITTAVDAKRYAGTLRGKIVLAQPAREVRMLEYGDGPVVRYSDQNGKWEREAMTAASDRRAPAGAEVPRGFDLMKFYKDEGVVAVFGRGITEDVVLEGSGLSWQQQRPDGGTVFVQDFADPATDPERMLPMVILAVEHYNRIVRLTESGVPVTVELDLQVKITPPAAASNFNVIGEIPGADKAAEVVLVGAHLDSWHAATGATDNAAGVAAVMEAIRVLNATGLRPRRTIRVALWGAEELDQIGSQAYIRSHLGTVDQPKAERQTLAAYFNLDNGTGKVRGVWMQENRGVEPIFRAWAEPLSDLGVTMFSPRSVIATDHEAFDAAGIPAFQFIQERYEYNSRTHHSNMDVYDRLQADDLKQAATVVAAFVWQAAMRDELLPRKPVKRAQ
jgi:carboxypeptidase Q